MQLTQFDLNLLVALDALLEEGSVTRAGRRVGISTSAMSHTLARLRELLDDPVLVRSGRQLVPTPRAQALREPLRDALDQLQRLVTTPARLDPATLRRAFTVHTTDHVALLLGLGLEQVLQAEAPGLDLYLTPIHPDSVGPLRRGEADLAIGVFGELPADVQRQALFEDELVVVVRRDHPAVGDALDLDRYCALSHILVAPRGTPTGRMDQELERLGRRRRVARTTPSFLGALFLAARTDHLLTVSRRVSEQLADDLGLRMLPTPVPGAQRYVLESAWHARHQADPAHAWFRDAVLRASAGLETLTEQR